MTGTHPDDPTLPLDPVALAGLSSPERGRIYAALELSSQERAVAEDAIRLVRLGSYRKAA